MLGYKQTQGHSFASAEVQCFNRLIWLQLLSLALGLSLMCQHNFGEFKGLHLELLDAEKHNLRIIG